MSKKIFVAALFLFIFSFNSSFAFWPNPTHQELTKKIIEVYNQSAEIKISQEQGLWVIEGSVKEDTPPRWINHFFDPVLNQGWTGENQGDIPQETVNLLSKIFLSIKDATSSINWAFDQKLQGKYSLYEGDQTYKKAVQDYLFASGMADNSAAIKPDDATLENAFKALGYVLHLIEDLGVPAHTRNDTHAGINESVNDTDPYEQWAAEAQNIRFDNFKNIKGNISCSDTKDCFVKLAKYSNENFYSKDTIGDPKYKKLENESLKIIGVKTIYFRNDNFGNHYPFKVSIGENNFFIRDSIIHQAYWDLLSKQVVLVGAQVIRNFFKDAQESAQTVDYQASIAKIDIPSVPMVSVYGETAKAKGAIGSYWNSAVGAAKNALSSVGEFFSGLFGNQNDFTPVDQISLTDSSVQNEIGSGSGETNNPVVSESSQVKSLKSEINSLKKEVTSLKKDLSIAGNSGFNSPSATKSNSQKTTVDKNSTSSVVEKPSDSRTETNSISQAAANCFFNNPQTPSRNKILINEVAWMGSTVSANDEWIELKNISNQNIDLSNWQIINKGRQIEINLSQLKNKNLASGGFVLLERTDDNSVPNITADLIYTGALSNSDEGLRLFDGACNLMDEILTGSSWSAGDNYLKKTMERNGSDFGWHTSAYIGGTPKAENSVVYGGGGGGAIITAASNQNSNLNNAVQNNFDSTSTASSTENNGNLDLRIVEVVYNPDGADEGNEYVKIFNFGDNNVNLSNSSLQYQYLKKDGNLSEFERRNFEEGNLINSQGYFKIGANCHVATPCEGADLSWSQALNNTNGTVFLVSNQELISDSTDADIVDFYSYPQTQAAATSTSSSSISVASSSVLNGLAAVFVKDAVRIDLNWQVVSSTDASSSEEIVYRITDASSSVVLSQTSSTSASVVIDEVGKNYDFLVEAINASSSVLASATTTISAPSFLSDLYFYKDPRNQSDYLVEGKYNQYPIAPSLYALNGWKAIVFYLNSDPAKQIEMNGPSGDGYNWGWPASVFNKVVGVKYVNCSGGGTPFKTLILPDTPQQCNSIGIGSERFAIRDLGLNRFVVPIEKNAGQIIFSPSDYITTAYYSFDHANYSSGGGEIFRLVAVDKKKYYFGEGPVHEAPQLTGSINLVFDRQNSKLIIDWSKASDSDTIESLLSYETRYNDFSEWQAVYATGTVKSVAPGDDFLISVRAKDEFGVTSSALTANWKYPDINFEITQIQADNWSYPFGNKYYSGCVAKSAQSIVSEKDFQFDKVDVRVMHNAGTDGANLKLSVFDDDGNNRPDLNSQLSSSVLADIYSPSPDLVFNFSSPVALEANKKYWLVLEVENYLGFNNDEQWARNQWQSAVSREDLYAGGEHLFYSTSCSYSHESGREDWYMKIGL